MRSIDTTEPASGADQLNVRRSNLGLVLRRPLPVLLGVVAQYVIMPLVAVLVVTVLSLPPALAAGVLGQVHGVESVRGELLPPRRQLAGRERVERGTGLVDGRVPGGELGDRVGELFLLGGDCQGHSSQLSRPRMRAALP